MHQSVGAGRTFSYARWLPFVSGRSRGAERRGQLAKLAATGVVFPMAMALFAMTANAVEANSGNDSVSALSEYVQKVAAAPNLTDAQKSDHEVNKSAPRESADGAYAALRNFARQIGADQSPSIKRAPKLAAVNEPSNFFDWLRSRQNGMASPAQPNATAPATRRSAPVVNAHRVGSNVCLRCHSSQAKLFEHTLMGRLMKQGKMDCETCHGPGSEHARLGGGRGVGGILSFEADDPRTPEEKNAVCLACHERGARTLWRGSVHQMRRLACVNCHTIMKAVSRKFQLKTAFQPDTCFQCHKDRRAQMFRSSHMPMREGKIVCSDCHSPHGSVTKALLKKDSINDVCYTCHAEKRGPFLYEHAPVRENCDNCHDPHGTVQMYSLKMARPRLCNECHNLMNNSAGHNTQFSLGQSCVNCHTAVHGSNSPNGQLFFR
jgi:DmsE family decaheme c-type cytochrome